MRQQIAEERKRQRSAVLRRLGAELQERYATGLRGRTMEVLWEQGRGGDAEGYVNVGYTDTWTRVRALHREALTNRIVPARLGRYVDGAVQGRPAL